MERVGGRRDMTGQHEVNDRTIIIGSQLVSGGGSGRGVGGWLPCGYVVQACCWSGCGMGCWGWMGGFRAEGLGCNYDD